MCKRLFLLVLFVLVLGVVCPVRGATIFHWKFDGPEGQEIISDVDIVGGKVATKFYDEGYDPNEQDFSLTYGEANPWWGVTGTSADYVREPGDNDPGVGFFVPDDAAVDLSGLSECTIEAFVYPREVIQSVIVRKYQGTGVYYIDTRPEGNSYHTDKGVFAIRMASSSYDTGDHNSLCHDVPYTAEEWHHVALVWTGTVMKFYMNGVQSDDIGTRVGDGFVQGTGVSEVPFEGPIGNSATALGIGCIVRGAMTDPCAPPSTGQFFNGRIDELIFSDVALSPEQLRINWPEPHASQPNPKNGTEEACPGDELCWKSGAYADQHDVYLGTDRNEVESATTASSSVYVGRQSANCVTPSLDLGETYYWRIDEVNDACSPFLWKGAVWEFSTNDGTAYNPDPGDEQTVIPLEPVLSWSPGCEATSHKVYFSTDFNDVDQRQAGAYLNEVGPNTIDPCDGELEYFTWYYWAVDETDGVSTWPGAVWSFRTQSAIIDVNMVAHYTLDEESGAIASDSSGYENHADVDGGPDEGPDWDANDGHWGGSLGFDDDTDIKCPTGLMSKISEGITVAVWLKDADRPGSDNWVFEVPGSSGSVVQAAVVEDGNDEVYWRAGNETNDVITWNLDGKSAGSVQGWHFWAFVKNEVTGEISIYFDGFVVESNDVVDNTVINVRNRQLRFGVGSGHSNDFIGRMDDIKVFDKGLSATQVASLFRGGDLGVAWAPDPGDNETEVPRDVNLAWQPGDWVEKHDVYLGTDWDDVNDATTSSVPTYRGRQDPCEYDPPTDLAMDTTYYWRIDEVNTADPNLWKGSVWTFTVANFVIIDDFEDYDDTNRVYHTWEDGQINLTGSYIDLGVEPFSPAHTGSQSMLYTYDNKIQWDYEHYWSVVTLPFDPAEDWTDAGVKVLTLYFYGDADNDANDTEELYVALDGSYDEVRYTDDAGQDNNDLKLEEWTEWNIPISEFAVDPCAVTRFYIGFGDKDNTSIVGGDGIVFIDDIRLYPPRCMPEILKPAADLSNDCIVSWPDVAAMGAQWLRRDRDVSPVQDPTTANLVGHWKLEGNADDSSGNSYDGTAEGEYDWIAGRIDSGAIDLSGGWVVVEDEGNTPLLRPAAQVSVMAWIRLDTSPETSTRVVIKGRNDVETYATEIGDDDVLVFFIRDVNGAQRYPVDSEDALPLNEWVHAAGTYDSNELIVYVNGEAQGSDTVGAITLLADANDGLGIGGRYGDTDLRFPGGMDDVRVYNRGLSRAEVAYIASEGTGMVLLDSPANLYTGESPEAINLRDLAVLFEAWLEEKLWPE